jgi:hypothetical protein
VPDKKNPTSDELVQQQQAGSAAAPTGLQQQAAASGSMTAEELAQQAGYTDTSQSWYTGANSEGTENGWDTEFSQAFVEGANTALEEGTLDSYFESKEAGKGTGIVLFDHTSTNGTEMKFGDIYQDGVKTGNVYQQFDEDTANLMLADWMFDGSEKAELYSKSDPMAALKEAVQTRRTEDSQGWLAAKEQEAFNEESQLNAETFQEGAGDEAVAGVAAVATGAMATGAAVSATGVGIIPGALIFLGGAALGGTAAYLNRDAISQQAGRAYTITSMSREEFGLPAAIGTGIEQWAGVAGKSISPFGNLVEGSFDVMHGEAGDGESEFFRIDASTGGESQVGGWWKTAHLAAAVGDAGLQFASPIGVGLYTTQMGSMITGATGSLALSGGSTFDYQTASFDNIFTDDQGNFDPVSAAAGVGKIGIDALQLGFTRGLAGKVDSSLVNVGEAAVYKGAGFNVLRPFRTAEQRTLLKEGGSSEILAGREFFKDAAGNVVSQRKTIQLLAPSESVAFMSTRVRALRESRLRGGDAIDVEDYYAAAKSLALGEKKSQMILVNAFGEGYEEGIQGVLEPWSHDHSVEWSNLAEQFAYGAAMGGGMSGSAAFNMASQDQKNFALAKAGWELADRGTLTKAEWDGMSAMEKSNIVALGNLKNQQMKAAHDQIVKDQTATEMATVAGRDKLMDAARKKAATEAKRSVPGNPDQAITIVALDDATFRADAVTSSSVQLGRSLDNRLAGFNLHLATLERELAEAKELAATDTSDQNMAAVTAIEAEIRKVTLTLELGIAVRNMIERHVERASGITDYEAMEAEADAVNKWLEAAFDRKLETIGDHVLTAEEKMALARAVSMVKTRDPQDANRSWQILVPQVDPMLTFQNSDGVVGISQTILPAIRGDYDGDKVRDQNQLMLNDEVYTSLRAGQQFYGAGSDSVIAATKSEKDNHRKLWTVLTGPAKTGLSQEAQKKIFEISQTLRERYAGIVDPYDLDEALGKFLEAMRSGPDKDARQVLVSAILSMPSAGALTAWSREQLSNEPAFIGRLVNLKMQEFQRIYARHTPRDGSLHPTGADIARPKTILPENQVVGFELRDDLGFQSNELGIIAVTADGRIAAQATYNEGDTYLSYHLASVNPEFQGQGLSASIRILFQDYAIRRGMTARFPDVINPRMADGYRARPEQYREITRPGDQYPSFESTVMPGTPEADNIQAQATRIRDAARAGETVELEQMATDVKGRAMLPGNTEGASLAANLPADSIMRLFQQLHYALNRSKDIDAQDFSESPYLAQMAEIYAALTSKLTRDVLSEIRGKDEVNTRVYAMLQILGRELQKNTGIDSSKAVALIANVQVLDFTVDPDTGQVIPGEGGAKITLAQLLLRKELEAWRGRNAAAWDLDPDLQAKYDRLIPLTYPPTQRREGSTKANAERAFVEVLGAQSMYELLGEAAEGLGSNLTVEQYVRMLADLTPEQRRAHAAQLRLDENYSTAGKGKTTKLTPPYSIEDLANDKIERATAFRSVVDSMISAANSREAERESASKRTSKKFWNAHTEIRRIVEEYAREQKLKISRDTLKLMLTNNPLLARRIYDLVPDSAANLAFPVSPDGTVLVSPWIYDMLMESDSHVAEMIYWRNLLMLQWDEVRIDALNEGSYADEAKLEYGKLKRRMHQIMWNLRNNHDGGLLYAQFILELEKKDQTVEQFLDWVNSNAAILDRAPIVAWYDDVADFDMNKAGGGWSDDLGGAELRTAIASLETTAQGINVVDDIALDERDKDLVDAIRRVVDPNRGATAADQLKYNQLQQRLKEAGQRSMALGPAAMFYQVFAAAKGFYAQAHAKGKNPPHLEAIAAHEALAGQYGYLTDLGRLTASVTAHTLDAVDGNVSLTTELAGRSMDPETGNLVEWDAFTPEVWLDMMSTPDSRKLARAIVSTQVMERDNDGVMRIKTMHGSSLQDLLDGTSYRDLFEKGEDVSQLDMDLRYLSTLEAEAGKFGGHFAVQRALNDFVIARLTSAKATVTDAGLERMVIEAMQDFARTQRVAASLPANLDTEMNSLDGLDPMDEVHDNFVRTLKARTAGRKLGVTGGDAFEENVIEAYVAAREAEFGEVLDRLLAEAEGDNTEARGLEILTQIEAHKRDLERFRKLYQTLKDDNLIGGLVQEYSIPDAAQDPEGNAAAKQRLIDYVLSHATIRAKVPEVSDIANRILANARAEQYLGFMENISDKEWAALADGVVAMRFDTMMTASAPSATVTPIPNPDSEMADRLRFYDPSFSYLAAPFMDPKHPVLKAARSIQRQSGRHQQVIGKNDVTQAVANFIFREGTLGAWTSDVPKFSIESHAGIDSASGIPAISIFGTLSQRDQTVSRAKERTYDIPGDELLSTVELDWVRLNDATLTNEVAITHPTGQVMRPLAQLLNRFAKAVTATYVDAEGNEVAVDLLQERFHVGRPFHAEASAAASGLYEVHTSRVLKGVERLAREAGVPAASIRVTIAFFHPDMKPAEGRWYNNLFFEGTSFAFDADTARSLPETLNFYEGGSNPVGQNRALDSRKKGIPGFFKPKLPSFAQVKEIESDFATDLAKVIREKTALIMDTKLGSGDYLDPEYYNAVYSSMMLRHYVEHVLNGEKVRWTAEQVIAHQLAGGEPLVNAELWIPPDDVLRSMLGGAGPYAVPSFDFEADPSSVGMWTGDMSKINERFPLEHKTVGLGDTDLVNRQAQRQLKPRARLSEVERKKFDQQLAYRQEILRQGRADRAQLPYRERGFDPAKNLQRALAAAGGVVEAEDIQITLQNAGAAFFPPRDRGKLDDSLRVLNLLMEKLPVNTSGFVYRHNWPDAQVQADDITGILTQVSMEGSMPKGMQPLPGDVVVVDTSSFRGDWKLATKTIDHFIKAGVIVVLGEGSGRTNMRAELGNYLESQQYHRVGGSVHVFQPLDMDTRYRNEAAKKSSLTAWGPVAAQSRLGVLQVSDQNVEENSAWVDPEDPKLKTIAETINVFQSDVYGGFNVPSPSQAEAVITKLRALDTPEGKDFLVRQSVAHIKSKSQRRKLTEEVLEAWDELMDRFDADQTTVLPGRGRMFGTGYFVPLVDQQGRIILARHGHKAPPATEIEGFLREPLTEGSLDAVRVAVYSASRDSNATSHVGTVVDWSPISKFGLRVRLHIDTQTLGNKLVFQWNGFKALLAPRPKRIKLPQRAGASMPIVGDIGVNAIVSRHDISSKQSHGDTMLDFQTAFWIFGVNFLPDVASSLGVDEATARDILLAVADMPKISVEDAHYINSGGGVTRDVLESLSNTLSGMGSSFTGPKLDTPASYQDEITRAMLVYLMTEGASVSAVLRSGSVGAPSADPNARAVRMPELFTQIFDLSSLNSPLRVEMIRRFQAKMPANQDGTGYFLHPDFMLEVRNSDDPGDWLQGYLQVPEVHASGDNPVFNDMSYDPDQKSAYSTAAEAMVEQALAGTRLAQVNRLTAFKDFVSGRAVTERQSSLAADGGVWRMLTGIKPDDGRSAVWRTWAPLEATYLTDGAEKAMVQFRQELDREGWSEDEVKAYEAKALEITTRLGLKRSQTVLVDYWVRQMGGRWKDVLEPGPQNELTAAAALEYIGYVLKNVEDGYFPTLGAEVPAMHLADVQLIYRANREAHVWQPRESIDRAKARTAGWNDWNSWAEIALGSILTADHLFHPIYLTALDGFLHTWEHALPGLSDLPVSLDVIRAAGLMDPDNNRMLISLSPQRNARLMSAPVLGTDAAALEEILGGRLLTSRFQHEKMPNSEIARHRSNRRKWQKENDVPLVVDVSLKDLKKNGIRLMSEGSNTSALMRMAINLRVGTALLNPMLYLSMGPEQWVRGTLDRTANLLTGQSTAGITGKAAARTGLSTFSYEQVKQLDAVYAQMGKDTAFRFSIWEELDFLNPVQHGQARVSRFLEKYARMGAMAQDPTRGMSAKTLARRYVEAALQIIASDPVKYRITTDGLISRLATDPTFIQKNMPEVHEMASNAVAQIRSLKSTPLSLMVRAIYEPFSDSHHAGWNFFGNLVLKLPLIFSTYAFNVATTITGMQGFSDFAAAFVDGRSKGFVGRIQSSIKGEPVDKKIDMSEVMEGIDLSRSFIRGGLTHTSLFLLGMVAGNLGLSGEDEETKRRRKLAALSGVHSVLDPRALENDFRNNDVIFLDWLPFGLDQLFAVPDGNGGTTSPVQLPWIMKQFFSPVIGMGRFFETGDFSHVRRGFEDAIGSFPLINTGMWADVVSTAHTLQNMAKEQEEYGREENLMNAMWFLTNTVGLYEKMLFENSFVNELYVAMDRYDRNPYLLPLRDSDGELQRDIEGNVRPNDIALEQFVDPDTGEVMSGYQSRNDASATLHALTENRATLAFVTSLFTGGPADSDFNRYNMPIKTRTVDADVATQDEAEAIIRAAMEGSARQGQVMENLSFEEILQELKTSYAEAGNWDAYNNVDVEARRIYKQQSSAPAALSILDDDGREVLTEAGAFAVLQGLAKGTVMLGDESLAGIHITFETREAIQKEWMAELKQEGLDLGLSESEAMKRVNRLWYGPTEDPTIPGIKDFLWSDQISYDKTLTYKQLNTTYVQGPDGRPWATGFRRDNWFNFAGILPVNTAFMAESGAMSNDERLNSTDIVNGINLGLRSLELVDKTSYIPTDKEIGDSIVKALEELGSTTGTPFTPYKTNSTGGGYGGGSYGGGGSGGYYNKMFAPPGGTTVYVDPLPSINTSNPYIRRADIRRERVWSEKGRLKQWQ